MKIIWGVLVVVLCVSEGAYGKAPSHLPNQDEMKAVVHERCPADYIVPHGKSDLEDIVKHIGGKAFVTFSTFTYYGWNHELYDEDYPFNMALVGFAQAYGEDCLAVRGVRFDRLYSGLAHVLQQKLFKIKQQEMSDTEFKVAYSRAFYQLAEEYGFTKYLIHLDDIQNGLRMVNYTRPLVVDPEDKFHPVEL